MNDNNHKKAKTAPFSLLLTFEERAELEKAAEGIAMDEDESVIGVARHPMTDGHQLLDGIFPPVLNRLPLSTKPHDRSQPVIDGVPISVQFDVLTPVAGHALEKPLHLLQRPAGNRGERRRCAGRAIFPVGDGLKPKGHCLALAVH